MLHKRRAWSKSERIEGKWNWRGGKKRGKEKREKRGRRRSP